MIGLLVGTLVQSFVGPWQTNRQTGIQGRQADIAARQADTAARQADVQQGNLEINRQRFDFERSLQQAELETQRAAVAVQRANVQLQRERFEHDRQQQREAVEERRRLQHEAAADRLKEIFRGREVAVIFENWPLRMAPVQYLPAGPITDRQPIKIIVAPPDWEPPVADVAPGVAGQSTTFALGKTVEDGLRPFLRRYYSLNDPDRPTELLGGAWQGKRVRSESAMVALFKFLGSEPTLVLETERVGRDLSLRVGYWGLAQSGYCFYEVGRIPYDKMAAAVARESAKRWRASREQLRGAGHSDEDITRYDGITADNLWLLEAEEKQAAAGVPTDHFASYKISDAGHAEVARTVAACHCLIASCVTDIYHLLHYDTPPLLPKVLPELMQILPTQWRSSLLAEVVQSFRDVYEKLAGDRPAWRPELLLDLAESLMHLPDPGLARGPVRDSLNSWLALRGMIIDSRSDEQQWVAATRAVALTTDRNYLERLANVLIAIGEPGRADEVSKLIPELSDPDLLSADPRLNVTASDHGREVLVKAEASQQGYADVPFEVGGTYENGRKAAKGGGEAVRDRALLSVVSGDARCQQAVSREAGYFSDPASSKTTKVRWTRSDQTMITGAERPRAGDAVLDLFDELRRETLEILDRAERISSEGGSAGERARPHISAARQAVDESRLNLVIVGAEGQGKSTLINALLGVQVTPEEARRPGTVAPVFISYSNSEAPEYSVQTRTEDDVTSVAGADEFRDYLLQAKNKHNSKDVRAGRVRIRHSLLEKGLQIVDMPGVEGVSLTVAKEAQQFIKTSAHTVIGIIRRSGGFGPMGRILSEMLPPNAEPQALVFNGEANEWLLSPSEPKSDNELRIYLDEQKRIVADELRSRCPALGEHPERVFVLHLPSFHAYQLGNTARIWVGSPLHLEEGQRLLAHLWGHVRENGIDQVILQATQAAEQAIRELRAWLELRRRLLATLESGGIEEVREELAAAKEMAQERWLTVYHDDVLAQLAKQAWGELRRPLTEARERLSDAVHVARREAGKEEGALSDTTFNTLKTNIETAVIASQETLEAAQNARLTQLLEYLLEHANAALDAINERMPIIRESIGSIDIDAESLVRLKVGSTETSVLERTLHAGGVLGTASVTGVLAGGAKTALLTLLFGLNPVVGLVVGIGAGALIGHGLLKRLRDPNRRGLLRALDQLGRDASAIDTSEHGRLRAAWSETVGQLARAVDTALQDRFAGIEAVFENPLGNPERLASAGAENERLAREISTLERGLTLIALRAAPSA
jgi:hypothetical protein